MELWKPDNLKIKLLVTRWNTFLSVPNVMPLTPHLSLCTYNHLVNGYAVYLFLTLTPDVQIHMAVTTLLTSCWYRECRCNLVKPTALHIYHPVLSISFKNIHSDLTLWMYSQHSKCFWKRYRAAWPFRGEPSSDQVTPPAAACSSARKLPGHCRNHVFTYSSHRQQLWSFRCCGNAGSCKAFSHVNVYKKHCEKGHSGPF